MSKTTIRLLAIILPLIVPLLGWIWPDGFPSMCNQIRRACYRVKFKRELKSRVPICLAIRSESPDDNCLIADLSHHMEEYIEGNHLSSIVEVLSVPDDELGKTVRTLTDAYKLGEHTGKKGTGLTARAIGTSFVQLHKSYRARLYVFGVLKRRQIKGSEWCILELRVVLEHRTLVDPSTKPFFSQPPHWRHRVNSTFSNVHINDIEFRAPEATLGIRHIAVGLVRCAQISIGLAASLKDDPYSASILLDQLMGIASVAETDARLLAGLLSNKATAAAADAMGRGDIEALREVVGILYRRCRKDYGALVMLSYATYLLNHDNPEQALQFADEAGTVSSKGYGTWRYNKAFLLAETGQYMESLSEYDGIASRDYNEELGTVLQVTDFFRHELRRRPQPVHILFILAFVYWMKMRTNPRRCRDSEKLFHRFLRLATAPEYQPLVARAQKYLEKIRQYNARQA